MELDVFLETVKNECSQFLIESQGLPVFKLLPKRYSDYQKVKVRKIKKSNFFDGIFNSAFSDEISDIRQRSLFVSGDVIPSTNTDDCFFVFPVDGYKYIYCAEVQESTDDYKRVFDSIFENTDNPEDIIQDLLKFSYKREELDVGIAKGAEIIFYNTPCYYALRTSYFKHYDHLIQELNWFRRSY